jgi:subtilisin family serine protease
MVVPGAKTIKGQKIPEAIEGEFVVQAHDSSVAVKGLVSAQLKEFGMGIKKVINKDVGLYSVKIVKPAVLAQKLGLGLPSAKSSARALSEFRSGVVRKVEGFSGVRFAEPNYIYRVTDLPESVPNDTDFNKLWAMKNSGQQDPSGRAGKVGSDIKATEAWALTTGSNDVVVAVIDTGVNYNHPDLAANIWIKPGTTNVHGYNAITDKEDPMDDHSHGSHCAGTIGGVGDNGKGVAGVSWKVKIMGVKFLSAGGSGSLEDAIKAIDYATANGAHIMSNSWGGGGFSQALKDSIQRAADKNILFIAAAGNDTSDNDGRPSYPASYEVPNVVSVAASNNLDALSYFSNWGRSSVHLMAPGENIWSTTLNSEYKSYSGTSMATPHVSGATALLLSREPSLTPAEVKVRLMATTDKIKAYRTKIASMGRLNLYNLMTNTIPPGPIVPPDSVWKDPILNSIKMLNYTANARQSWVIKKEGAKFLRIHFKSFRTEAGYDKLKIKTGAGELVEELSGNLGSNGFWSTEVEGDTMNLEFTADESINDAGFEIDSFAWTDYQG